MISSDELDRRNEGIKTARNFRQDMKTQSRLESRTL
jgi:hypothetical protein